MGAIDFELPVSCQLRIINGIQGPGFLGTLQKDVCPGQIVVVPTGESSNFLVRDLISVLCDTIGEPFNLRQQTHKRRYHKNYEP